MILKHKEFQKKNYETKGKPRKKVQHRGIEPSVHGEDQSNSTPTRPLFL